MQSVSPSFLPLGQTVRPHFYFVRLSLRRKSVSRAIKISRSKAFRMSLPNMVYYAVICPVVPSGSFVVTTKYEAMVMLHFLSVCVDLAGREANAMLLTPGVVECSMLRQRRIIFKPRMTKVALAPSRSHACSCSGGRMLKTVVGSRWLTFDAVAPVLASF